MKANYTSYNNNSGFFPSIQTFPMEKPYTQTINGKHEVTDIVRDQINISRPGYTKAYAYFQILTPADPKYGFEPCVRFGNFDTVNGYVSAAASTTPIDAFLDPHLRAYFPTAPKIAKVIQTLPIDDSVFFDSIYHRYILKRINEKEFTLRFKGIKPKHGHNGLRLGRRTAIMGISVLDALCVKIAHKVASPAVTI